MAGVRAGAIQKLSGIGCHFINRAKPILTHLHKNVTVQM